MHFRFLRTTFDFLDSLLKAGVQYFSVRARNRYLQRSLKERASQEGPEKKFEQILLTGYRS